MNITRENIDALNAVVTVEIEKNDYSSKVEKVLTDYRKTANIPGFRKGHVPMGMVKKQYGKAVLVEEVNKLIQENLNQFIASEKLELLGNPLPRMKEDINWDADKLSFEFELGLAPEFKVNLKETKEIIHYNIVADDATITNQIENIRKQYGTITPEEKANKDSEISGVFKNEEKEIENSTIVTLDKIKSEANSSKFVGAKVGDVITVNTKDLFNNDYELAAALKLNIDQAKELDVDVTFEISEVNKREMSEMNQEFFDKLFGKDAVTSEDELKERLKADAAKQFGQQADQKLLNDVTEQLIEEVSFDLPQTFLEKWMQTAGEKPLTEEEAKAEYAKSEKGLRYQLIEGKIFQENNLQVTFEELKGFTKDMIKVQMAQFGQTDPSDKELEDIAARILSNQEEVKRINQQMVSQKMLDFFKENANLKTKELTYEEFIKEVYS